jgi:hypothetical protein
VTQTIAGFERVLVVTYNPTLAHSQWLTLQTDLEGQPSAGATP